MEIPDRVGDDGEIATQVGHDVEGGGNDGESRVGLYILN